jgi:hypothetical protein
VIPDAPTVPIAEQIEELDRELKTRQRVYPNWVADGRLSLQESHRLIAAAPDLLAALDYLLEQTVDMDLKHGIELTEGETEAREQALAAIKKATNQNP